MPRNSVQFDRLDAAVQDCIASGDRCTALVFSTGEPRAESSGLFSLFGMGATAAAEAAPEMTLLVLNGRVAYKTISGVPMPHRPPAGGEARARTRARRDHGHAGRVPPELKRKDAGSFPAGVSIPDDAARPNGGPTPSSSGGLPSSATAPSWR